ncbi:metallophosphoesterase [Rubinisphaera margarita]|uniref:metallophosphoesterase n=1 Tax=Rubinisphaera margarita TaxID=2909586 RepID=UPI001EE934C5|nr:metallophosphoesterase [Rubinisphaera margarita]MCG6154305.1 metallophosphoesterase [Rubinisphaera margarita]
MKIGIVSDTHGNVANTERAVEILRQSDVSAVLHCGDICGVRIVDLFVEWPTHFVTGNCDNAMMMQNAVETIEQTWHGMFGEIELGNRKIALLHSHEPGRLAYAAESGDFDLVCYGHTHQREQHKVGETLVLNPGAIHRANPHTIAIVDLETMTAEHIVID